MKRRGLALILVVGVLAILAVLGSAFAVLSRLERRAAAQRVLGTQALLLSRSGIEDATARLGMGQDPDLAVNRYGGEDWDLSGGALSALEGQNEVYRSGNPDRESCPVAQAMRPSFFVADSLGKPTLAEVDGRKRGFSGRLAAGTWALRVQTGGFDINGGNPAQGDGLGYNAVLERILGTLAEAIDREDGSADGSSVAQADGVNLVKLRPQAGWTDWERVKALALGGSQAKLDALRPYLALHAWVDRKVIKPNATFTATRACVSWSQIRQVGAGAVLRSAPVLEGRPPVDLNWARRYRPALVALLAGLRGIYLDESTANTNRIGTIRDAKLTLDWTQPMDDCRSVAGAILGSTSELETWQQFNDFCDALPLTGVSDLGQAKKDLLKANFNPNSDLNKFNPDRSLARLVDKSDLLVYSTEFSLVPAGNARLSSLGRVPDGRGRILASRLLSSETSGDRLLRLTTQAEFSAGDLGTLDVAGDEKGFRTYGDPSYITFSLGSGRTFGHKAMGNLGASLQTGPEPHTASPACWDGQLRLATVETEDGEYAPAGTKMMFLARWEHGADGDLSGAGGNLSAVFDAGIPDPSASLWSLSSLNFLYPDGWYGEENPDESYYDVAYEGQGNFPSHRGTLSFWVKPNYDQTRYITNKSFRAHVLLNHSLALPYTAGFLVSHLGPEEFTYHRSIGFFWESAGRDVGTGDEHIEQARSTPSEREWSPHRWHLVTCLWDMNQTVGNLNSRILVDRGLAAFPEDRNTDFIYQPAFVPAVADFGTDVFCLSGERVSIQNGNGGSTSMFTWGNSPDSTYDEFAIYDFGPATGLAGDAIERSESLARERFGEGRCYKENDGTWFSAPIDLGPSRLLRLDWTQIVPRGLRAPYAGPKPEDGDPGPDGRVSVDLAGQALGRRAAGLFRIRAVFQPNLDPATKQDKAVLEPLVLDDVTLFYRGPAQPGFLAWSEGD